MFQPMLSPLRGIFACIGCAVVSCFFAVRYPDTRWMMMLFVLSFLVTAAWLLWLLQEVKRGLALNQQKRASIPTRIPQLKKRPDRVHEQD